MATITNTVTLKITIRRIYNDSIEKTLQELQQHMIYNSVIPNNYDLAKFSYSVATTGNKDDPTDPDNYPLQFISNDRKEELWISCTASGAQDLQGTQGTLKTLKMMGFNITVQQEQAILASGKLQMKIKKNV